MLRSSNSTSGLGSAVVYLCLISLWTTGVSGQCPQPVQITQHPVDNQHICSGQSVDLHCTATGTGPISYSWERNGASIAGAHSSTYTATEAGAYRCRVNQGCSGVVFSAIADVYVDDVVVVQHPGPIAPTMCAGTNVLLEVWASGAGPFFYQWQRNGQDIPGATGREYVATIPGGNSHYRCRITNNCGWVYSQTADVVGIVPPSLGGLSCGNGIQPTGGTICNIGGTIGLNVAACGTQPLSYQWYRNGVVAPGFSTNYTYGATQSGQYYCVISNSCGSVQSNTVVVTEGTDCNGNGIADDCEGDCNGNGYPDPCDIIEGWANDCNSNGIPDSCDIASGTSFDINNDGIPDECGVGAPTFQRGDCNDDGSFTIADPVRLLAFLSGQGVAPTCDDACDCEDNDSLNIADAVRMLTALFGMSGQTVDAPFPHCGVDPTDAPVASLGCDNFAACP